MTFMYFSIKYNHFATIHWDHTLYSVSAAEAVSRTIGHNPGQVTTLMQHTQMAQSSQQAGTHFANLRWTTG